MTEILSPAGNFQKLKTAVFYGADSVYLAGQKYGLRSGADNFSTGEIERAVAYCRRRGCRVYVALNSFFHDEDFAELEDYLGWLDEAGADAVICSDLGVVEKVLASSKLPVHVSTQASVLNTAEACFWRSIGAKRVVLGRELSVAEAGRIRDEAKVEVEIFIHGSMCMSYSGHCTISNYAAGRDSNRGGCIQSCRHLYRLDSAAGAKTGRFMSSKDLNGMALAGEAKRAGVDSLKIEGRMKSLLYVAATTRAYSNLLAGQDAGDPSEVARWSRELAGIPGRGNTEGSLRRPAGRDSVDVDGKRGRAGEALAGRVVFAAEGRFFFQAFNKIEQGVPVRFLGRGKTDHVLENADFFDTLGNRVDMIRSNQVVGFESELPLAENMVAAIPSRGNAVVREEGLEPTACAV